MKYFKFQSRTYIYIVIGVFVVFLVTTVITRMQGNVQPSTVSSGSDSPAVITGTVKSPKSDDEWRAVLTPNQFHILREAGTEVPFTGSLLNEHRKGTYVTADCNEPVFRSEQKFESGTGWPSFWAPINKNSVILKDDFSLGIHRIEVIGAKCRGHLGHLFDDGPQPTGLRYCINSAALKFIPDEQQ